MSKAFLAMVFLLLSTSAFAQGNDEPLGGKVSDDKAATTKRTAPKPSAKPNKPLTSPCGNRADASADDKWFSLGESASKHFWYNPGKTTCDAKTGVLKSWLKEEHKNTDSNYALVLYEFKCHANQIRVDTVIEYDNAGSVLDTNKHENDPWQDVAPGTAGATMIKTVCRRP